MQPVRRARPPTARELESVADTRQSAYRDPRSRTQPLTLPQPLPLLDQLREAVRAPGLSPLCSPVPPSEARPLTAKTI